MGRGPQPLSMRSGDGTASGRHDTDVTRRSVAERRDRAAPGAALHGVDADQLRRSAVGGANVGDRPLLAVDLDHRSLGEIGGEPQRVASRAAGEQHDVVDGALVVGAVDDGDAG